MLISYFSRENLFLTVNSLNTDRYISLSFLSLGDVIRDKDLGADPQRKKATINFLEEVKRV